MDDTANPDREETQVSADNFTQVNSRGRDPHVTAVTVPDSLVEYYCNIRFLRPTRYLNGQTLC